MSQQIANYNNRPLDPIRGRANRIAGPGFGSLLTVALGQLMALVTAAAANERQTISITGSPTGGTFTLAFSGFTTAALPFNATAAQVKAALEALPNIGLNNTLVTGGALPGTPIVVEFVNSLSAQNLPSMTASAALTGGTTPAVSIAETQAGVPFGKWVVRDASVAAPPPVLSLAGTGASGFAAGSYVVQATYLTAAGETTPGPAASVAITAGQQIRVSQITGVPTGVTGARFYVNGVFCAQTAVSGGNIPQTDLASFNATVRLLPQSNTAYLFNDGRHIARAIARRPFRTDEFGLIIPSASGQTQFGMSHRDEYLFSDGLFDPTRLVGLDALAVTQLSGRFLKGDLGIAGSEFLIPGYLTD